MVLQIKGLWTRVKEYLVMSVKIPSGAKADFSMVCSENDVSGFQPFHVLPS